MRPSPDEIQAAIRAYKTELRDAEALVFELVFAARNDELKRDKAALRRLSGNFDQRKWEREFRQLMATLEKVQRGVGKYEKRSDPEHLRWFWSLFCPSKPETLRISNQVATLEVAKAEFEAS